MISMLGERLAEARKRAGLSQVELAVAMGERYDQKMVSHVERGRSSLRSDGLVNAAKELGVSTDYLLGLTDDPTPAAQHRSDSSIASNEAAYSVADNPDIRPMDVLEVMAAAGSGAEAYDETPVGRVFFRSDWLQHHRINPAHCHVISVKGESMEPTLPDGCSILVDRSRRELVPKRIYVMRTEDGLVVKRVDRNRDGWWLISENPAWLPVMLTEDADIVGEVRWAARTF